MFSLEQSNKEIDIIETVSLFFLEKLCAETVYIFLTYLEAEFSLGALTKVVGNFL